MFPKAVKASAFLLAALFPAAAVSAPADEILSRIEEIPFPDLKKAAYGVENLPQCYSTLPIGFFIWETTSFSKRLDFPMISLLLKEGAITDHLAREASWLYEYRGTSGDPFKARSLADDVARIRQCLANAKVSQEEPPQSFTILCLSLIYYAHACGELGYPAERAEILEAVSPWLTGKNGEAVVVMFENDRAQVLFDDAVFFLAKKDSSRAEAARRFALVAKKFPKLERGILSAKYVKLLEEAIREQAADPMLSGPEPSEPNALARWRVHRLQEQCFEGYMSMNCFTGPLFHLPDSPFARVEELGVAAIPALLELEGKERLARWYVPDGGSRASAVGTVQEMVPRLLFQICGTRLDFASGRKWWEEAQRKGVAKTMASELSKGENTHFARHLAALDAPLAVRSLMQASARVPEDEMLLSELHRALNFDPDIETIGLARQMLGNVPGSIPWCAGIHVLARTFDRAAVLEAAAKEWRQPSGSRNRRELKCLARVLIWNEAFDIIGSSLNLLTPERKLVLLEAAGSLNDGYSAGWGRRILMSIETEQQILRLLARFHGDQTKVPECGKIPYDVRYKDCKMNRDTTFATLSRSMSVGIPKARTDPDE